MADTTFIDQTTAIVAAWLNAVNSLVYNYAADSGAVNAYVVTAASTITSLTAGLSVRFKAANANTGASTLNVNGLGIKAITTIAGAALVAGAIPAGGIITVTYDGTAWQMISSTAAFQTAAQTSIADAGGYYTATDVEGALQEVGATNTTQNTDISTLQGQMTTADGNITTLQGQMTTANGNITTLQGQVAALEGTLIRVGTFTALSAGAATAVTFSSAFPTGCLAVVLTQADALPNNGFAVTATSTTGFTATCDDAKNFNYVAIGH